jgi:hypothetical protein
MKVQKLDECVEPFSCWFFHYNLIYPTKLLYERVVVTIHFNFKTFDKSFFNSAGLSKEFSILIKMFIV